MMANGVNPCASMDYSTGRSLLHYLVMKGDLTKIKYILPYCSRTGINYADKKGRTALHLSINVPVYFHSLLITKALCTQFANANISDCKGQSPLHRACILGEILFVQEILNRGAKVDVKDGDDRVPLECCKEVTFIIHANYLM
jgi:ankyrin repeat protein